MLAALCGASGCGGSVILVDGGPGQGGSGQDGGSTTAPGQSSGGNTGTGTGGAGGTGTGGTGGGTASGGTVFAVCPATMPSVGDGCDPPGQGCAYIGQGGTCQAIACDATGHWQGSPNGC